MSNELELNKDRADADRYYKLFADKVGKIEDGERILFIHIGNFDVLDRFIQSNPNCSYFIIDQYLNGPWFEMSWDCKFIGTNEDDSIVKALETFDMKFDKIIMNPPYSKNLHLKVLAKAIEKLDENGTCVNLSPIRWLQDPYNQFKKTTDITRFNESILNHLKSVEVIDQKTANSCFNIELYVNLGVYTVKHDNNKFNSYENFWKNGFNEVELSIFNKISSHKEHLVDVIEHNKRDGVRVLIALIGGNRGMLPVYKDIAYAVNGMKDGKDWTKCKNNGGYEKQEGTEIPNSIKFNTEKEAQNFYNSYKTGFAKFICNHYITDQHIPDYWLPWMGDAINPRTKKKGYASEWTDDDFYKFFGITKEEQELIEKTMEKYK